MSAVVLDFPAGLESGPASQASERIPGRFSRGEYRQLLEFAAGRAEAWTVKRQVSAEGDQLLFVTPPDTPFGIARWMLESEAEGVSIADFAEFEIVARCADMAQVLAALGALAEDRAGQDQGAFEPSAPAEGGPPALQAA
jgi:hypothetical protein